MLSSSKPSVSKKFEIFQKVGTSSLDPLLSRTLEAYQGAGSVFSMFRALSWESKSFKRPSKSIHNDFYRATIRTVFSKFADS